MCHELFSECFTNINSLKPLKHSTKKSTLIISSVQKGKLRPREKGSSRARVQKQFPAPSCSYLPPASHRQSTRLASLWEKKDVACTVIMSFLFSDFLIHYLKYIILLYIYKYILFKIHIPMCTYTLDSFYYIFYYIDIYCIHILYSIYTFTYYILHIYLYLCQHRYI